MGCRNCRHKTRSNDRSELYRCGTSGYQRDEGARLLFRLWLVLAFAPRGHAEASRHQMVLAGLAKTFSRLG